MSPIISEVILSGFTINSALRRRTHLVLSFSVVFLYWFYVFS
ncbi:Choline transporter-like protein 5 [Bienertia sinuspersici]